MIMNKSRLVFVLLILFIGGCSSGEYSSSKEHFLKDQVQALEKAKGVEHLLQGADDKRRQTMEEQSN